MKISEIEKFITKPVIMFYKNEDRYKRHKEVFILSCGTSTIRVLEENEDGEWQDAFYNPNMIYKIVKDDDSNEMNDDILEAILIEAIKSLFNNKEYKYVDITEDGDIIKYTNLRSYTPDVKILTSIHKNQFGFESFKTRNGIENDKEALDTYAKEYAKSIINTLRNSENEEERDDIE